MAQSPEYAASVATGYRSESKSRIRASARRHKVCKYYKIITILKIATILSRQSERRSYRVTEPPLSPGAIDFTVRALS